MRDNIRNTDAVFEVLSRTAAADTAGGQPRDADATDGVRGTEERDRSGDSDSERKWDGDVDRHLDELLAQALAALPVTDVEFSDELVKGNLDELLLVLIALHDGTHGDELLSDLSQHFETTVSPGTLYPALHELEEAGFLSMHAKVRTKEYSLADETAVQATIERSMLEHLAFGLLLSAFLARY